MRWLVTQAEEQLLRRQPHCHGVLFEVEPIDFGLIERWPGSREAHGIADHLVSEQSRRLWRISLFQNMGAALLLNDRGRPIQITQACLAEPLLEENEKSHFLMFRPGKGIDFPTINSAFFDMYYDLAKAGFGPSGANIPGYLAYLEVVIAREKLRFNSTLHFGKLYLNSAMKEMLAENNAAL